MNNLFSTWGRPLQLASPFQIFSCLTINKSFISSHMVCCTKNKRWNDATTLRWSAMDAFKVRFICLLFLLSYHQARDNSYWYAVVFKIHLTFEQAFSEKEWSLESMSDRRWNDTKWRPAMEAFKVSSIFSFCHCISKASDKSHGSVIVLYIYFTF